MVYSALTKIAFDKSPLPKPVATTRQVLSKPLGAV